MQKLKETIGEYVPTSTSTKLNFLLGPDVAKSKTPLGEVMKTEARPLLKQLLVQGLEAS